MKKQEKERCYACLINAALVALLACYGLYAFTGERTQVRIYVGWITLAVSLASAFVCFAFAYWQNLSKAELSARLRDVYFCTGLLALATAGMGLGGAMTFTPAQWDLIYNLRPLPVLMEVYAVTRLFIHILRIK